MGYCYVQYGCGFSAPQSWRNFDASLTLRFERLPIIGTLYTKNSARFPENVEFGYIVYGLPVKENSCQGVYCSHILEHLSLEDFRKALPEVKFKQFYGGRLFKKGDRYYRTIEEEQTEYESFIIFRETSAFERITIIPTE